jgi:FkbH-like protein
MFEVNAYDRRLHPQSMPAPLLPGSRARDIAAMSFLFWSEHCVQCAAPDCYASCALYDPRSDGRCRRFVFGIFRNPNFASARGYGAEIAFRRWGKLKANGNTRMEPLAALIRRERQLAAAAPFLRRVGCFARALGVRTLWADPSRYLDKRARRLHRCNQQQEAAGGSGRRRPDAFLIEVYNPQAASVVFELEMRIALDLVDEQAASRALVPFRQAVTLPHGYSRHAIDYAAFAAVTDCGLPFKLSLTPMGEATPRLVILTLDFVAWSACATAASRPAAAEPPPIKCAVFDLDETLWHGTLLEGDNVRPRAEMGQVLAELDRRGILLAIASKNDATPALDRLRRFGLADYFVATKIDWRAKSKALVEIAAELNLGLDTFAFIDDSAFERAEVAAALPQVACFDVAALPTLLEHGRMSGSGSTVARSRRRLYREAARRAAAREDFADDEVAFLRACRTRLEIARYREQDFERVVELAQRTNQLNASGRRYGREACADLFADANLHGLVLRCVDVHGDYGVIGFASVRFPPPGHAREIRVEEFMLSCRVQGRMLEWAFFHHLAMSPLGRGAPAIWINFRATARNGPLARVLADLGFYPAAAGGRALSLPAAQLCSDVVRIVDDGCTATGVVTSAGASRRVA